MGALLRLLAAIPTWASMVSRLADVQQRNAILEAEADARDRKIKELERKIENYERMQEYRLDDREKGVLLRFANGGTNAISLDNSDPAVYSLRAHHSSVSEKGVYV